MNNFDKVVDNLKQIIEKSTYLDLIPHVHQDAIRVHNFLIRSNEHGFLVTDKQKKINYKLKTKSGALAFAKNIKKNKKMVDEIVYLDRYLFKHQQDSVFYKHHVDNTTDPIKKGISKTLYEISLEEIDMTKQKLNKFIFDQLR